MMYFTPQDPATAGTTPSKKDKKTKGKRGSSKSETDGDVVEDAGGDTADVPSKPVSHCIRLSD